MKICIVLLLVLLGFVTACSRQEESPGEKTPTSSPAPVSQLLLGEPLRLDSVELTPASLAVWRRVVRSKTVLLLLSNDPLLQPVPEQIRPAVMERVRSATAQQLAARGSLRDADPLILRDMTVDAALRAGFFSHLIWVIPRQSDAEGIDLEVLRRNLMAAGFASEDEVATLQLQGEQVFGQLRNIDVTVTFLDQLKSLPEPLLVHIDLSYFAKLYRNEIKTPLLPLLYSTLQQLQALKVKVLAVTSGAGNLEGRISLDVRYLGEMLATLFKAPAMLDQEPPQSWRWQGEIQYLTNFIQKEKVLELALQMEQAAPQSAWVKFTLCRAAQERNDGEAALTSLAQAVQVDSVYALEYENLAEQAYDRGRPDAALQMLKLAQQSFPDNPHLRLRIAQLANELGDRKTALELARPLQSLDWSEVYYPQMPQYLEGFIKHLEQGAQ
jgi:tetratricopeptide (TPR) repeat protein